MFGKTQRTDSCNELKHRVTFFSDFNLVSHFNVKHSAIRAHSRTQNTSLCVDAHDSYCATFYVMIHLNGRNYLGAWIMWIILNKAKKKKLWKIHETDFENGIYYGLKGINVFNIFSVYTFNGIKRKQSSTILEKFTISPIISQQSFFSSTLVGCYILENRAWNCISTKNIKCCFTHC